MTKKVTPKKPAAKYSRAKDQVAKEAILQISNGNRRLDIRQQRKLALQETAIYEDCMTSLLDGSFGPSKMLELISKHKTHLPQVRLIAVQAASTLRSLQQLSDNPEEAKSIMKANIHSKLENMLNTSIEQGNLKTANLIIANICKLQGLYESSNLNITNTFGVLTNKLTIQEMEQIKLTGQIPEHILQEHWQQAKNSDEIE